MFLRYAKPDDKNGKKKPQPAEAGDCQFSGKKKRHSGMSSLPHLSFHHGRNIRVGDDSTSHTSSGTKSGESTLQWNNRSKIQPSQPPRIDPYLERSIRGFEQGCIGGLKLKHGLAHTHAVAAAKAFGNAAEIAASGTSPNSFVTQFASYQAVVDGAMDTRGGGRSMAPTTRDDSLTTYQRQQDEIYYLRLAVKNLVLQLAKSSARGPAKQSYESEQREAHQNGVPTRIELRSISVSEATEDLSQSQNLVDSPTPTTVTPTRDPMEDSLPYLPTLSFHMSCPLPHNCEEKVGESPESPSHCKPKARMAELFLSNSHEGNTHPPSSAIHALDDDYMVGNRTHGTKVEINVRGNLFLGRYNGKLSNGVPNGQGVLRFDNRDLYMGEFLHGFMHGEGTLFCMSSGEKKLTILRGKFEYNGFMGVATYGGSTAGAENSIDTEGA
jgi:hypothetical protein